MEPDLDLASTLATAMWLVRRADALVIAGGRVEFIVENRRRAGFVQWPGTGGVVKVFICTSPYDLGS